MTKKYSVEKKEKLVNKIKRLKNKEDFITIFNIIQEKEQKPIKEVGDSTMMFFHDLKNQTYEAIDKFLKDTHKKQKQHEIDQDSSKNTEYKPYSQDEFPHQKTMSPKLKYSNRERNLIKRKRYDQTLMEENGSDVVYCKFNVENATETDVYTTETENNISGNDVKVQSQEISNRVSNYLEENDSESEDNVVEKKKSKKEKSKKKKSKKKKEKAQEQDVLNI